MAAASEAAYALLSVSLIFHGGGLGHLQSHLGQALE